MLSFSLNPPLTPLPSRSYARIRSIARKAGVSAERVAVVAAEAGPSLDHPKELALAMHILRFPEARPSLA